MSSARFPVPADQTVRGMASGGGGD
jgi:hypothetical protein